LIVVDLRLYCKKADAAWHLFQLKTENFNNAKRKELVKTKMWQHITSMTSNYMNNQMDVTGSKAQRVFISSTSAVLRYIVKCIVGLCANVPNTVGGIEIVYKSDATVADSYTYARQDS